MNPALSSPAYVQTGEGAAPTLFLPQIKDLILGYFEDMASNRRVMLAAREPPLGKRLFPNQVTIPSTVCARSA